MTEIAKCGCGGTPMIVFRRLLKRPCFIRCSQCHTRTDSAKTLDDAVAFWNLAMTGKEVVE